MRTLIHILEEVTTSARTYVSGVAPLTRGASKLGCPYFTARNHSLFDVSKPLEARQLIDATVPEFERIDILVNNAGI